MEPSSKRIKLSLEPSIEKTVVDITETGHEVLKTDLSLPEQLMRNVDRVWYERGDWKHITEEQLKQQLSLNENNKDTTAATDTEEGDQQLHKQDEKDNKVGIDQEENKVDLGKLRDSVISKLHFAKCEIDVALDVINILATENKQNTLGGGNIGGVLAGMNGATGGLDSMINNGLSENTGSNNNLILPPGALHATYVSKPKLTDKAQLEQAQLTLGLKRAQQKTAADYLKKSAASLKKLVSQEQVFWDEAVGVRSNHWLMQASRGDSGFFINYGFADVGSDFGEVSYGEMLRSEDADVSDDQPQVQLSLPHNTLKQVRVTIRRNQLSQPGARLGGVLGLGTTEEKNNLDIQDICPTLHKAQDTSVQRRLIDAQSTVYDAELFSRILSEAQVITSNIQCEEDCVIVTLDGQVDILIQKSQYDQQQEQQKPNDSPITTISAQQLTGQTIEMALRLLLVQRHRLNLWKSRTRLMSGHRKTQQLLNSMGDTTILPGSATGTAGSTTLINNSVASGTSGSGSNSGKNATAGGGGGGGSSTPIISHRTTTNTAATGGSSSSSSLLSSSSMARQMTGGNSSSREPYSEVPLLSPVISMTRFWVLFDRIRDVVHDAVDPLCGETGLGLTVHFKPQHIFNNAPHGYCDAYPGFSELTSSLSINLFKGSSLRFALNQSGTITATSPGSVVTLANVTEFESFLLREINLICLHQVCDIANFLIRRSSAYQSTKSNERVSYIWQVDEVEEILYGAVNTAKAADPPVWKTIQVQLNQTKIEQTTPAYVLQFKEDTSPIASNHEQHRARHPIKRFILLSQWQDVDMDTIKCSVGFRDKVAMMVQQLLE